MHRNKIQTKHHNIKRQRQEELYSELWRSNVFNLTRWTLQLEMGIEPNSNGTRTHILDRTEPN